MADKQTQTYELKAVFVYADDDTKTITVPNCNNYTSSQANDVRTKLNAFGAITIGDKTGAAFESVKTAYIENTFTTKLDLTKI